MTSTDVPDPARLPQGDLRLLETEVARRLLASTELVRLAYVVADGTPRVDPMFFHWSGSEVVVVTLAGARKVASLRGRPQVALTIDAGSFTPEVLLIRGPAVVEDVQGIASEYALMQRRYLGEEQAAANLAALDRPETRMARIAIRPAWVGVLDFQTRFPGAVVSGVGETPDPGL